MFNIIGVLAKNWDVINTAMFLLFYRVLYWHILYLRVTLVMRGIIGDFNRYFSHVRPF